MNDTPAIHSDVSDTQIPDVTFGDFVDRMMLEKEYPPLDDAVMAQIKEDLLDRLDDYINARIIAAMTDEQAQEFNTLLKGDPTKDEVQQFIAQCIPDGAEFISLTLLEFRREYLGLV